MFSDVVVFSTYATYVVMSFMMMVMVFMMLSAAQVSAERINEVLDRQATVTEGAKSNADEVGTVEFKNVSFAYPEAQEEAISDISFRIEKGQTLAIIGATGCGKTTLISLIARFYDATKGEVLVDGVNVKDYTFDGLYNKIGYITQKAVLFAGSIREILPLVKAKMALTRKRWIWRSRSLGQRNLWIRPRAVRSTASFSLVRTCRADKSNDSRLPVLLQESPKY